MVFIPRRFRFIGPLVIVLLFALLWQARDRVVPALVNPLLPGSQVEDLQGLELTPGHAGAARLTLVLASGATLELHDLQLSAPLGLVFGTRTDHSHLTARVLTWTQPREPADTTQSPEATDAGGQTLSALLRQLQRFLPQSIAVDRLQWRGQKPLDGTFTLQRNDADHSISARLSVDGHQLQLQLTLEEQQLQFDLQLAAESGASLGNLRGSLQKVQPQAGEEQWHLKANTAIELEKIPTLPIPGDIAKQLAGASGTVQLAVSGLLPDRVTQLEDYRDLTLEIRSEAARIPLPIPAQPQPAQPQPLPQPLPQTSPQTLIASLRTTKPLTVAFNSIAPLQPASISGSGELQVTQENDQGPLLTAEFNTDNANGESSLRIDGSVQFAVASRLLDSPQVQKQLAPLALESPTGSAKFQGRATVRNLSQLGQPLQALSDITITLLPQSALGLTVVQTAATPGSSPTPAPFDWHRGTAHLELDAPLTLSAASWPGNIEAKGHGIKIQLQEEGGSPLTATLSELSCLWGDERHCSLQVDMQLPELASAQGPLQLEQVTGSAGLAVTLTGTAQQWQLQQLALAANKVVSGDISVENISLQSGQLHCSIDGSASSCHSPALQVNFATANTPDLRSGGSVELQEVQFDRKAGENRVSTKFQSDALQISVENKYKATLALSGMAKLAGDRIKGNSEVRAGNITAKGDWHHDLQNSHGAAQLTLVPVEFSRDAPLSHSLQGLPVDIVAGTISATGAISWPLADGNQLDLNLEKVAAVHGDVFAVGTTGQLSLRRRGKLWQIPDTRPLSIDTLDVGLPIEKIRFAVSLDKQQDLTLHDISAELLEGTLQSDAIIWNLAGKERHSKVHMEGLSLHALATEMDAKNFAASGILDVQVPLITGPEGFTVEHGQVQARPPGGRLRYYGAFSPEMLSSNPSLKLIAGALEDYNYRELTGTFEYPPSGDMQMALKLVGRSDSVAADRDLIINLNLENNVPNTLRSLQTSRNLTEALEKRLQ